MIITTNIDAMKALRSLDDNNQKNNKTLEKLASGLKINRAADDSAGLSISAKMRAQIRGLEQATRNVEDASSLVVTLDGALSTVSDIIQRIRELTVQAGNDTYSYTDRDRAYIQLEIEQLIQEIDKISKNTEFNGRKLLDGSCMDDDTKNELLAELHAEIAKMLGAGAYGITAESCVSTLTALLVSGAQTPISAPVPAPEGELGSSLAEMNYTWTTTNTKTYANSNYYYDYSYGAASSTYCGSTESKPSVQSQQSYSYPATTGTLYYTCTGSQTVWYGTGTVTQGVNAPPLTTGTPQSSLNTWIYNPVSSYLTAERTQPSQPSQASQPSICTGTSSSWSNTTTSRIYTYSLVGRTSTLNYIDGCQYFQPDIEYTITTEKNGVTGTEKRTAGQTWSNVGTSGYLYMLNQSNVSSPEVLNAYIGLIDDYIAQLQDARNALDVNPPFPTIEEMIKNLKANRETAINTYIELELIEAQSRSYQAIQTVENGTGLWFQTGANAGQGFLANIYLMNSETLGIGDGQGHSKITVDTPWYYENTGHLYVLDYALNRLTTERSLLGATQNRLDYIKQNLGISNENHQTALSRIQDANIAREHMSFMITNILQQAATTVVAQANSKPETVLQLLR